MLKKRRTVLALGCCALTLAGASLASAGTTPNKRTIKTTQRITTLFSTAQGATNTGTSDGKIGGVAVHGALRTIAVSTSASTFTATGRLFYPTGTLSYTLEGTSTTTSSGDLSFGASGKFTGGTGSYTGARGSFAVAGAKPLNSYETWTLTGKVS